MLKVSDTSKRFIELPDEIMYKFFDYISINDFSNIKLVNKKCNILMKEYMKKEEKKVICYLSINDSNGNYEEYLSDYHDIKFRNEYFYSTTIPCLHIYKKINDCNTESCLSNMLSSHIKCLYPKMDFVTSGCLPCSCKYKNVKSIYDFEEIDKYINENIERITINHLVIDISHYYFEFPYKDILKRMLHEYLQKYIDLFYNTYNIYITELYYAIDYANEEEYKLTRNIMNEIITTLLNKTKYELDLNIRLLKFKQNEYNFYYDLFKEIEFTNDSINIIKIPSFLTSCLKIIPNVKDIIINDIVINHFNDFILEQVIDKCFQLFINHHKPCKIYMILDTFDIDNIKDIIDDLHDIYFIEKIIIDINMVEYNIRYNVEFIKSLNDIILNKDKLILIPKINDENEKHNKCIIS